MSVNFSTTNVLANGHWQPRKTETLTCPSGQSVLVRRPGPEFMLRAGRVARTFSKAFKQEEPAQEETPLEYGLSALEKMSDEELAAVMIFGRELVCAMMVSPKLVLEPRPGFNEIGPDDIGDDFWFLFNHAMSGFFGLKVPVGNEEVEVSDLSNFRDESSVQGDSVDSSEVRANPVEPARD